MAGELTPAQRKFLRSAARSRRPDMIVGKDGISESVLRHILAQLAQRELVKVRLPRTVEDRTAAAEEIAGRAGAALADLVGRVAVLYRPNEQLPEEKRIHLPGR